MVMAPAKLSLLYSAKKGVDQGMGRSGLWLVSFGGQIDEEAVVRMSGRHQMILLRNLIS